MPEAPKRTRRYVLAERPAAPTGPLREGALRYEEDVPVPRLEAGQVLVKVAWMSLDPATRSWMNNTPGSLPPSPLGETMRALGAGTVSASAHPDFTVGERVCGLLGWQEDAVVNGSVLRRVPEGVPLNACLNVLGIAGQTAWLGLHDIGQPRKGETVVVTAAAGSVGSVAVQLAIAAGARVIGVAGTPAKCAWVRELGADECVDYREDDVSAACSRLCPDGIDVIFDNVGGESSTRSSRTWRSMPVSSCAVRSPGTTAVVVPLLCTTGFTCCSTGSGWKVSSTWTTRLASMRSKPISCPACATAGCAAGNT